ncbi:DUF742 domain-containing protein [Streptomyces sp. TRM 70351]|uniref:DUF742 domain-containing protein n=1 Tax=Streptomyces sp. TRM 70351 TaxID=3116552 RepID=UPI002E7C35A7|nr:DUF742 domain-containing protein [Streptomyces sp. TRM 70351]MEE1927295.1 DUF742 domain-containing protein [Streptomyces sp. TRM 70351]
MTDAWFDDAAGPVVRPYAMTRGRTRSGAGIQLDLIALVTADAPSPVTGGSAGGDRAVGGPEDAADLGLAPEHLDILRRCHQASQSVAELAADLDLPVGVVRVLVGDLVTADLVRVTRPVPPAELPDESILRGVIDGLRAL